MHRTYKLPESTALEFETSGSVNNDNDHDEKYIIIYEQHKHTPIHLAAGISLDLGKASPEERHQGI